ncbi:rhodanese-like domain-containing protein [Metasolibacillus meyeri]|uniref:rhodanese-like domain-containing protein n=1 Tax=Metasolibacillus meyeri TaxID=1071052 RepID=UPI000D3132B5|nr:rhodanese-like domain-containing protein [Metasolibacillus meyeri]
MKKFLLGLVLLLILSACSSASYETISLDAIASYIEQGYEVVDVREPIEYGEGHIPNAINLPLSSLQQGQLSPLEQGQKYIIICRSGNRSQVASDILHEAGYSIVNVSEGMSSWTGEVEY